MKVYVQKMDNLVPSKILKEIEICCSQLSREFEDGQYMVKRDPYNNLKLFLCSDNEGRGAYMIHCPFCKEKLKVIELDEYGGTKYE